LGSMKERKEMVYDNDYERLRKYKTSIKIVLNNLAVLSNRIETKLNGSGHATACSSGVVSKRDELISKLSKQFRHIDNINKLTKVKETVRETVWE
jgi:hypothetical protein